MKKKPVQKKVLGGVLGAAAGKGAMVPLGIIPQLMYRANKKAKASAQSSDTQKGAEAAQRNRQIMEAAAARAPRQMAKGGKVTRGDGVCTKGKTKGRYI